MVFLGFSMISSNHGNPRFPSFLGVITHILGVLNLHFSWALGVQWNEQMRSLKTSLCLVCLEQDVLSTSVKSEKGGILVGF